MALPVTAQVITAAILGSAPDLKGPSWLLLASAVGEAVSLWARLPSSITLTGVVTGTVGGGKVTGKLFIAPTPIPLPATVLAAGFSGPLSPRIGAAIGMGVSTALNASAGYTGNSIGAIGADVSKVIASNPATLTTFLVGSMASRGLKGPQAPLLASGVANGIAAMILTGIGTGVAAGAPGPSPAVGSSISKVF